MIEFTSLINVTTTNCSTNKSYDFLADHFTFTPSASDDDAGNCYNCDKTFVIDMPSKEELEAFRFPRWAVVTLKSSDQKTYKIGTDKIPVRVSIAPHLNKANLVIKGNMLSAPLS